MRQPRRTILKLTAFTVVAVLNVASLSSQTEAAETSTSAAANRADDSTTRPPRAAGTRAPLAAVPVTGPVQRAQPNRGPGGSESPFTGVQITAGGTGADAWYVAEPVGPRPKNAPVVVMMHGYGEGSGYANLGAWMRHTALQGNVVIYPRWQTTPTSPCPGPFDITPCEQSAVKGIKDALTFLRTHPDRVQPRLHQAHYIAHSFGAVVTLNIVNEWKRNGLPKPKSLWLDEPDDSGLTGTAEAAVDDDLTGIPPTTKVVCLAGADGTTSPTQHVNLVYGYKTRACNIVFPMLGHIAKANKALVMNFADDHGSPALSAPHGVCSGDVNDADTYDWGLCWRSADALRACALHAVDCGYALGNTARNRFIGTWSDGTPVVGLKVQTAAPITADSVAPRQVKPRTRLTAPTASIAGRLRGTYSTTRAPHVLRGAATSSHGVAFVHAAVIRRRGDNCSQLLPSGRFAPIRRCSRPTAVLWAHGQRAWRLALPALPPGDYTVRVRAIDSYGRASLRDDSSQDRFRVTGRPTTRR